MEPRNEKFKPKKEKEYFPKVSMIEYDVEDDPEKFEKIIHFAERYRIPYTKSGYKKTFTELLKEIKNYEGKHIKDIAKIGKDRKYDIFGLYIH
jgi:hypothetical protein